MEDVEGDDTILYNPKDTFIRHKWPGCLSGTEEVTIPHPMILVSKSKLVNLMRRVNILIGNLLNSSFVLS